MRIIPCILIVSCFVLIVPDIKAQDKIFDDSRAGIFDTDISFAGMVHTAGWGLNFRYGDYKGAFKKHIWEIELASMKHPKEHKSYNPFLDNSIKGYVYGKKNTLTILRPSFLFQKTIYRKQSSKGVAVSRILGGGPALGFEKPVYLVIGKPTYPYPIKDVERYDENEHYVDNIISRGPWLKGIGKMKIVPGLHLKGALEFEYATDFRTIKALEVGATLDAFYRNIDIMAFTQNHQVFFNLYVALRYGGKKTLQ